MSATPATIALSSAGIPFTGHEYQHDTGTTDFGRGGAGHRRERQGSGNRAQLSPVGATTPYSATAIRPSSEADASSGCRGTTRTV
jgi:hypothetical protein